MGSVSLYSQLRLRLARRALACSGTAVALVAVAVLVSAPAFADRLFSDYRALRVDPVDGAERYEWAASTDGETWTPLAVATSTPLTSVQAPWGVPTRYRVRAIAPPVYSEWSEASELATWLPNGIPPGQVFGVQSFGYALRTFGLWQCAGEWRSSQCSCAQGGPCPPP